MTQQLILSAVENYDDRPLPLTLTFFGASARFSDSFLGSGGVRLGPVVGATEFAAGELTLSFLLVSMNSSPFMSLV